MIENYYIFFNQSICLETLMESQLKVVFYKHANDGSVSGFVHSNAQWVESESYINNCIWQAIYMLFKLLDHYVC